MAGTDLIRRQAAIDALGEKPLAWTEGECFYNDDKPRTQFIYEWLRSVSEKSEA